MDLGIFEIFHGWIQREKVMFKGLFILATAVSLSSSSAMAGDDQGHNGDEATTVSCQVLDTKGVVLPTAKSTSSSMDGKQELNGESDIFSYHVELGEAIGMLTLTDKRSGDKVTVKEGDFDVNEVVAVSLITDESPESALTLECVAR